MNWKGLSRPSIRISLRHMGKGIFSDRKHLQNIASEDILDHAQINFREFFAHPLLRGIID